MTGQFAAYYGHELKLCMLTKTIVCVCMCVCVCVRACVRACVCVCEGERERDVGLSLIHI